MVWCWADPWNQVVVPWAYQIRLRACEELRLFTKLVPPQYVGGEIAAIVSVYDITDMQH
jgi:hypothetical protein